MALVGGYQLWCQLNNIMNKSSCTEKRVGIIMATNYLSGKLHDFCDFASIHLVIQSIFKIKLPINVANKPWQGSISKLFCMHVYLNFEV